MRRPSSHRRRSRRDLFSPRRQPGSFDRALRCEMLEDRRLLAMVVVDTDLDVVDFNDDITSLREAIITTNTESGADVIVFNFDYDGPATILLEQGELEITESLTIHGDGPNLLTIDAQQQSRIFCITAETGDFTFAGLSLTGGMTMAVEEAGGAIYSNSSGILTIDRNTISGNSTGGNSAEGGGVFARGNITLIDSTISGNSTRGEYSFGGGIYTTGDAILFKSTVSDNSATGKIAAAAGGGVFARDNITLFKSTISGNSTRGEYSFGGGIYTTGDAILFKSTISGNSTAGDIAYGGGLFAGGEFTLTGSTVSNNSAEGSEARGGGMFSTFGGTLSDCTISGNSTAGDTAYGGGVFVEIGHIDLCNCTIIGNSTTGISAYGGGASVQVGSMYFRNCTVLGNSTTGINAYGGGVFCLEGGITLANSTVIGNSTVGNGSFGGGVLACSCDIVFCTVIGNFAQTGGGGLWIRNNLYLLNSIVAGNQAGESSPDLGIDTDTMVDRFDYNLIGDNTGTNLTEAPIGSPDSNGNLIGGPIHGIIDPLLGPLSDNGGPTQTHALLPGSPALDAGDPTIQQEPDQFDQRGDPFLRVADGDLTTVIAIDIGAYEAQAPPSADFDSDNDVDGSDFLAWQRGYGTTVGATRPDGNSDDDEDVDASDLAAWEVSFGDVIVPVASVLSAVSEQPPTSPSQQTATSSVPTLDLHAELVDAAIAMDQALRSESGARLGSHATLREGNLDWFAHRGRWSQPPAWRGAGEIADHSFRGQSDKGNGGRFHRNADVAVDEELLDELFAEGKLMELL